MNLFTPVIDPARWHPNFASVLMPERRPECDLLAAWADGFVDRDGKFVEEFQTTFNSSFWEIYLFALFKSFGITVDWTQASPDFSLRQGDDSFIVEATTANAAQGQLNEWDKRMNAEELEAITRFRPMNTEAMIRLSNAIHSKARKYDEHYRKLVHAQEIPFVIAVAPFEQPHFNLQHDRPIRALLYDHYVDEDAFLDDPQRYPEGPPSIALGQVLKKNGAPVRLGLFNTSEMASVSAVIFSCMATWGKLAAMSDNTLCEVIVSSLWSTPPHGAPQRRVLRRPEHAEAIHDGLQVYHNPHATHPLAPDVFRRRGVVQHYFDFPQGQWIYESVNHALLHRIAQLFARERS